MKIRQRKVPGLGKTNSGAYFSRFPQSYLQNHGTEYKETEGRILGGVANGEQGGNGDQQL